MVSGEDISYMERLKSIMEGKKPTSAPSNNRHIKSPELPQEKNIEDDMKAILERFNRGNKNTITENKASNIIHDPIDDYTPPPMMSKPLSDIKRVMPSINENYQIVVELYPGSKVRKLYSIIDGNGNKTKYSNLNIFEAAQLIVESLMTSKKVNIEDVLEQDKEYGDLIKESLFYRSKVEKCKQLNEAEAGKILEGKAKDISKRANLIQTNLRNSISIF